MRARPPSTTLEAALGIRLDQELLERALTHRSYAYEHGGLPTNERLEFLGDSVLSVVITTALYLDHPSLPEGQLAKLRASLVNQRALADVARGLGPQGLGAHMLLGKGEESTGGRDKSSILSDTLEALLGAVFLQHGLPGSARVIHRLFDPLMADAAGRGAALDWKTSLQELTAELGLGVPEYRIEEAGPDHAKTFTAWAVVSGQLFGGVDGGSKKEAEQRAAETAWRELDASASSAGADGSAASAGADGSAASGGADGSAAPGGADGSAAPGGADGSAAPGGADGSAASSGVPPTDGGAPGGE